MAPVRHTLLLFVLWAAQLTVACSPLHSEDSRSVVTADLASEGRMAPEPDVATVSAELPAADVAPLADASESPRRPLDMGCVDTDSANDFLKLGYVVYADEDGQLVLLYDTCKAAGPNGMLKEVTCNGYHGPETDPADLEEIFVKCDCEEGACVEGSVVMCTDYQAGEYHPGGSVWTNDEGKTHISVCKDPSTVSWYYCNDNGTFHEDDSACDPGILCGDGMCGGFVCTDTEPPWNRSESIAGSVFIYSPTTGETWMITDGCSFDKLSSNTFNCPLHTGTSLQVLKELIKSHSVHVPCSQGKVCVAGICGEGSGPGPDPDPDPDPKKKDCQDDDPADDLYKAGLLVLTSKDGAAEYFPDQCSWFYDSSTDGTGKLSPGCKVIQYDCDTINTTQNYTLSACKTQETCIDGACIKYSDIDITCAFECFDSDQGEDVLAGGAVYLESVACGQLPLFHDHCPLGKPSLVDECFCEGGSAHKKLVPCPPGHFCRVSLTGARCIACQDSDEDDSPSILGVVDDVDGVHITDFCNSQGQLKQAQCDPALGTAVWAAPQSCPVGTVCLVGVCQ